MCIRNWRCWDFNQEQRGFRFPILWRYGVCMLDHKSHPTKGQSPVSTGRDMTIHHFIAICSLPIYITYPITPPLWRGDVLPLCLLVWWVRRWKEEKRQDGRLCGKSVWDQNTEVAQGEPDTVPSHLSALLQKQQGPSKAFVRCSCWRCLMVRRVGKPWNLSSGRKVKGEKWKGRRSPGRGDRKWIKAQGSAS